MSARRDIDRRQERGDYEARKQPSSSSAAARRPQLNEYWIDGEGINRAVLQLEICKYLGAEATCRPGDYNGRPGYKIKAIRPFTPQMIEDLQVASQEYESENRHHKNKYRGEEVPYEKSETYRRQDPTIGMSMSESARYAQTLPTGYAPNVSNPYAPESSTGYITSSGYPPSSVYPPGTAYTMAPGISSMGSVAPNDPRYQQQTNYTYGRPPVDTGYPPQGYTYPQGPGYVDPRSRADIQPSGYYTTGSDPSRMQRDPYYDTQMSGVEPSPSYAQQRPHGSGHPQGYDSRDAYGRQRTNDTYGRR